MMQQILILSKKILAIQRSRKLWAKKVVCVLHKISKRSQKGCRLVYLHPAQVILASNRSHDLLSGVAGRIQNKADFWSSRVLGILKHLLSKSFSLWSENQGYWGPSRSGLRRDIYPGFVWVSQWGVDWRNRNPSRLLSIWKQMQYQISDLLFNMLVN